MDKKKAERKYNSRKEIQKFIQDFKKRNCCVKCGWREHPEILHFHHLKKDKISTTDLVRWRYSLKKVKEELDRCILLCPNCHYWLHRKEEDW